MRLGGGGASLERTPSLELNSRVTGKLAGILRKNGVVASNSRVIGFSAAEMDLLIEGMAAEESGDPEDEALPAVEGRAVSQKGDLWLLGPHRLFCGDATDRASFERLMDGAKAEMIFTDPPYNVPIEGHVSGLGEIEHREFAMASGEMHPRGRPRKKPDTHAELLAVLQERGVGDDRR